MNVYRKAAEVIRNGGLYKGGYQDWQGTGHCTVGALMMAVNGELTYAVGELDAVHPEIVVLGDMLGGPSSPVEGLPGPSTASHQWTITAWNDSPERTQDEVIALLEQAAEKTEADL